MLETILQSVGRTPLVQLRRLTEGLQATVAVKVEIVQPRRQRQGPRRPGHDRRGRAARLARPGGTIIEATAGNTGVGLAMVAAVKGYRCIFVLPDKMTAEKILLLKAYGAEVVITPTDVAPDSPDSYNGVADRLAREIPGAWRPNQFTNLANPEIHYRTTGPEIWEQTDGKVTVFVAGVGTGGTISGVARYLKELNPDIKIIGADPEGSVLSGGTPKPWKVEGIGEDFVPKTFNSQLVDDWVRVGDAESFHDRAATGPPRGHAGGRLERHERGGRPALCPPAGPEHLVVTLGCDTGRNYLTQVLRRRLAGREQADSVDAPVAIDRRSDRANAARGNWSRSLPDATAAEAIDLMEGDRHLAVAGDRGGRQAGRQRPGSDAGPRAARQPRSERR